MEEISKKKGFIHFLFEYSGFLLVGSAAALVWANVDNASYTAFFETDLRHIPGVAASFFDSDAAAQEGMPESESGSADNADSSPDADADDHAKDGDDPDAHDGDDDHDHDKDDHDKDKKGAHGKDDHGGGHSGGHPLTLKFIIDDILMAFFFAIAGKEVWESLLPGGDLSEPRKAATPLMATAGGILGPVAVYMTGVVFVYQMGIEQPDPDGAWSLARGWAIPCATDIAFSYLVARIIFGPTHPAISFLLLLAIADDAAGLVILAVFYPQEAIQPMWFLLTAAALATAFVFHKVLKLKNFWWYLVIPGVMSWVSFYEAGIHAALGLVPIIPLMPHAHTDLGIFAREELGRHDTLNEFEHWWEHPVEIILGLFGLANAGVMFNNMGSGTWLVLAGLLIGKPGGITLFTWLGGVVAGLKLPEGMNYRHIVTLGMVAGIGFTVALFVSTAAFPTDPSVDGHVSQAVLDAAKMGALFSFAAGGLAFALAKILGIKPVKVDSGDASKASDEK